MGDIVTSLIQNCFRRYHLLKKKIIDKARPKPCIGIRQPCKAGLFWTFIYYVVKAWFLNAYLFALLEQKDSKA